MKRLDRLVDNYVATGPRARDITVSKLRPDLARAEHDALRETNSIIGEKERLNDLMGRPADTPFQVVEMPQFEHLIMDQAAAQELALAQRPEMKARAPEGTQRRVRGPFEGIGLHPRGRFGGGPTATATPTCCRRTRPSSVSS